MHEVDGCQQGVEHAGVVALAGRLVQLAMGAWCLTAGAPDAGLSKFGAATLGSDRGIRPSFQAPASLRADVDPAARGRPAVDRPGLAACFKAKSHAGSRGNSFARKSSNARSAGDMCLREL